MDKVDNGSGGAVGVGCVCKLRDGFLCEVLSLLEIDGKIANVAVRISLDGAFAQKIYPIVPFMRNVIEIYETTWKAGPAVEEAEPVSVTIDVEDKNTAEKSDGDSPVKEQDSKSQ